MKKTSMNKTASPGTKTSGRIANDTRAFLPSMQNITHTVSGNRVRKNHSAQPSYNGQSVPTSVMNTINHQLSPTQSTFPPPLSLSGKGFRPVKTCTAQRTTVQSGNTPCIAIQSDTIQSDKNSKGFSPFCSVFLTFQRSFSFGMNRTTVAIFIAFLLSYAVGYASDNNIPPKAGDDVSGSPRFLVKQGENNSFHLRSTNVTANVVGIIADVRVRQVYFNSGKTPVEAMYIFPASTRAAVYGMTMTVGNRLIKAVIKEKEQARTEYAAAVQQGKAASLLEQLKPNIFQMNVANILGGDSVVVELRYSEAIVASEGVYEFVYPGVVGPRYVSGVAPSEYDAVMSGKDLPKEIPGSFNIITNLSTGVPVKDVQSPSHTLDIQTLDPRTNTKTTAGAANALTQVRLAASNNNATNTEKNRDYILRYRLTGRAIESGLLLSKGEEENYFMLMVQPPRNVEIPNIVPREFVFIVDVSGSMWGFPLDVSRKLMDNLFTTLRPTDKFNIMLFSGGSQVLAENSINATPENIEKARTFMKSNFGGGGTELLPALKRAFAMKAEPGYSRSFVAITDGFVTIEREAFDLVRKSLDKANIYAFGIGPSVNRYLIEGLAHAGKGEPMIVSNSAEAPAMAERFRQYIEAPVLTGIKVDWGNMQVYDVDPLSIPDATSKRPIVVYGKWKGDASGTLKLTGTAADGAYTFAVDVAAQPIRPEHNALRYLWARNRIALIEEGAATNNWYGNGVPSAEEQRVITDLGLRYNLLTKYTSFIAVDSVISVKKDIVKDTLIFLDGEGKVLKQVVRDASQEKQTPNTIAKEYGLAENGEWKKVHAVPFLAIPDTLPTNGAVRYKVDFNTDDEAESETNTTWDFRYGRTSFYFSSLRATDSSKTAKPALGYDKAGNPYAKEGNIENGQNLSDSIWIGDVKKPNIENGRNFVDSVWIRDLDLKRDETISLTNSPSSKPTNTTTPPVFRNKVTVSEDRGKSNNVATSGIGYAGTDTLRGSYWGNTTTSKKTKGKKSTALQKARERTQTSEALQDDAGNVQIDAATTVVKDVERKDETEQYKRAPVIQPAVNPGLTSTGAGISIRGSRPQETQMLIDGENVPDAVPAGGSGIPHTEAPKLGEDLTRGTTQNTSGHDFWSSKKLQNLDTTFFPPFNIDTVKSGQGTIGNSNSPTSNTHPNFQSQQETRFANVATTPPADNAQTLAAGQNTSLNTANRVGDKLILNNNSSVSGAVGDTVRNMTIQNTNSAPSSSGSQPNPPAPPKAVPTVIPQSAPTRASIPTVSSPSVLESSRGDDEAVSPLEAGTAPKRVYWGLNVGANHARFNDYDYTSLAGEKVTPPADFAVGFGGGLSIEVLLGNPKTSKQSIFAEFTYEKNNLNYTFDAHAPAYQIDNNTRTTALAEYRTEMAFSKVGIRFLYRFNLGNTPFALRVGPSVGYILSSTMNESASLPDGVAWVVPGGDTCNCMKVEGNKAILGTGAVPSLNKFQIGIAGGLQYEIIMRHITLVPNLTFEYPFTTIRSDISRRILVYKFGINVMFPL